jgi:hypothetical protein
VKKMRSTRKSHRITLSTDMRWVLGTVAHNRDFSVRDVEEYARFDRPLVARQAKNLVRQMLADGHLTKTKRGHYYPTKEGWAVIEGRG